MKKRIIFGLLGISVIAVMAVLFEKEVGAVTCVNPYTHKTYTVYGLEKHSCVASSTGSGIFDWGGWGISKKSIKSGLGLSVRYFGTEDAGNGSTCGDQFPTDPDCLIRGLVFCCNGGGQCGGQGQPFTSAPLSALAVLTQGNCDSTGKCSIKVTLDAEEEQLECQNHNWGGTFTPEEMYVQSCTCDGTFDTNGICSGPTSCNVEHCQVDLTDYQPGTHKFYDCTPVP